ncbi:MAG: hypothetical protein WC107_02020 [Patescibacteria group bacterium]
MAKIRCSNCEKGIKRLKNKNTTFEEREECAATGEDIDGEEYYKERICKEFTPRLEYMPQFKGYYEKFIDLLGHINIKL